MKKVAFIYSEDLIIISKDGNFSHFLKNFTRVKLVNLDALLNSDSDLVCFIF